MALVGRKLLFSGYLKPCNFRAASNKSRSIPKALKIERQPAVKLPEGISSLTNEDFKTGLKRIAKKLQDIFNIQPFVALDIISKNKSIARVPVYLIRTNCEFLIKNNVSKATVIKYASVLCETELVTKFNYLKKLPYENLDDLVPLLRLSISNIRILTIKETFEKRIQTMVELMEATIEEVCDSIARRPFLIGLEFERLKSTLTVLRDYKISKNQILSDLWVLTYKPDAIKTRFDMAKENNVDILKTWMIRVPIEVFQKHIKKKTDHKMLLGDNSFLQYLSERLKCSEDVAQYILMKQPVIQNRDIKKLNEMIDFLFSYGYTPIHIIRSPKILVHSVETCRKRLKELEDAGVHLDGISLLTKSKKQYTQYVDSLRNKVKNVS